MWNENIAKKTLTNNKKCLASEEIENVKYDFGLKKLDGGIRKGQKKQNFCLFCETYVLNFSRHITRNHSGEPEVQKIINYSPKNKNRKELLRKLLREGNFLNSSVAIKPLRQPNHNTNVLPCTGCKGFLSTKQLWRHRKKCTGTTDKSHQSKGQDLLLKNMRTDKYLRENVFPKMRPDNISLIAKTDDLICAFGARYIKTHREKHFIPVTSRKMRELARLLIELKQLKPSIKNFFEALKPENFHELVLATKKIGKYNDEKDYYESASTAVNMGTTIKQCCQLAITFVLKRKKNHSTVSTAEAEADIKTLIQLLESEWKYEISTQALNDLNQKKWNKVTMVPLANDLKQLNEYLNSKAESAVQNLLINGEDKESYIILLETTFCRVLILNRRRPGELQRLYLHTYKSLLENRQQYEEFSSVVSPSEQILLKRFKRIVIRGKRGRGVPVLFSADIQGHIEILLKYRNNFVRSDNQYLFGHPNVLGPICGYKIIKKHAQLAGVKNPQAITATRLRKHLATIAQVFKMTENDIEQLSMFMGHTVGVHRGSYRLPDDVFQIAKLSKFLILMEKGEAAQYKGKTLDEINVDLDINIEQEESDKEESDGNDNNELGMQEDEPFNNELRMQEDEILKISQISKSVEKSVPKKRTLVAWTDKQKKIVCDFFKNHIKKSIPPKKKECMEIKQKFSILDNKDWLKIKVFVQNQYSKKKKK